MPIACLESAKGFCFQVTEGLVTEGIVGIGGFLDLDDGQGYIFARDEVDGKGHVPIQLSGVAKQSVIDYVFEFPYLNGVSTPTRGGGA